MKVNGQKLFSIKKAAVVTVAFFGTCVSERCVRYECEV